MSENDIDYEQAESLGITREAYDEILDIVGRIPTIDELSTLLAMWESNGRQQSLYGWLRGQHHAVHRDDYLYTGNADHKAIKEPRVKECLDIARKLFHDEGITPCNSGFDTGLLLYVVGNISSEFASGEYARRCLHLVDEPMAADGNDDDCRYIELILGALGDAGLVLAHDVVAYGGLFCSLLRWTVPLGFDILAPREVRLDAFLFGEATGRYLAAVTEPNDDAFLLKMDEARLNCCFLGRTTKNRVLVDGFDFGQVSGYIPQTKADISPR